MNQKPPLRNWEKLYQEQAVESMPWFNSELDSDIEKSLIQLNLTTGNVLDVGTGPGTQAIILAQRGFQVTATDLSETAIKKAAARGEAKGLNINWKQDDILNSKLEGEFDLIIDRGCFHVFPPESRQDYVNVAYSLLKPESFLFLKCFSSLEPREGGPHKFTPEGIKEIFSDKLEVISVEQTVYYGNLDPHPLALFTIMQKT
ncbi:SAM-dependent methyltransferase [[Phormidium ambiguum] IAM M-71]|uniref:SAM-dependent methyltransferase n=2 Tax=[Phormidium ambiguum] IAM M-71 TaxID=454136 RepID=A0A1U7IIM0_9CYAN|nr:SAM-dependent methyltransferase [Phormidium ambiguum IAM M-71]